MLTKYVLEIKDFEGQWLRDFDPCWPEMYVEIMHKTKKSAFDEVAKVKKNLGHECRVFRIQEELVE